MTSNSAVKLGGWRLAGAVIAQGLAGHQSVGGKQLFSFASFVFSLLLLSSFLVIELTLSQPTRFLHFHPSD